MNAAPRPSGATVARVVVDVRTKALDRPFDYAVPEALTDDVKPGVRVLVPFGRQNCLGYVVGVARAAGAPADRPLKPVASVLDERPVLTPELLALTEWLTERYVCTRLEAIQAALPGAFRIVLQERYRRTSRAVAKDVPDAVRRLADTLAAAAQSTAQLVARHGAGAWLTLQQAIALGLVEPVAVVRDRVSERTAAYLVAAQPAHALLAAEVARRNRAPRQASVLQQLRTEGTPADGTLWLELSQHGLRPSDPAVKALTAAGLVKVERRVQLRRPASLPTSSSREPGLTLTPWQQRAVASITERLTSGGQVLLHGVTGSGKTEVYLQSIARCLDGGRSAIVLVPEISLTPQMVARFTERFGDRVAVLHSALSAGERRDAWLLAAGAGPVVVIGARSAVFAPVQSLGLLVIDEAHEPSYKQEETPFYDAREVAQWRAEQAGAALVLGSATPSLAEMARVERGEATLVTLPERVNRQPLPPVEVVDMRDELKAGNRSLFSRALYDGLMAAIGENRQAILFLNRRGYSAFLLCRNCGYRADCPNCDISLTVHRSRSDTWLLCHYCGHTAPVPDVCPDCGADALRPFGVGTQQVEAQLQQLQPGWRTLRMDVDTTSRKGAHQEIIRRFGAGEADVLIGTQMVAKGLDFPRVAFVGVVSADTMLAVPDYRANERAFSLLTQVAGRAGRADVPGRTVIQTYQPDHHAIQAAARHDFAAFYRRERAARETYGYPPFCELAVMMATHSDAALAEGAARRFERELRRRLEPSDATVLPACRSSIGRVENRYRYQVVVKYQEWRRVQRAVREAYDVVAERMRGVSGQCVLDVQAGRI
ncbi:MAG: primosomal protein N' [Alicyclobacillus sp.]|nr:primosomal protein N' [Alicyclobacillus sp.]